MGKREHETEMKEAEEKMQHEMTYCLFHISSSLLYEMSSPSAILIDPEGSVIATIGRLRRGGSED